MWGLGRVAALLAAGAVSAGLLAAASPATDIGANDDTGKYAADGGAAFFAQMASLGLRQTIMTVRFRPGDPAAIPDRDLLDRAIPNAVAAGLRVVLVAYPYPPRELEQALTTPADFAAWLAALARRYPQVRQFVVMNEPNQSAFVRPQFGPDGRNRSAAVAGAFLAAGYDALKEVDPGIEVVGVGLSPRGNDDPHAPSNVSTSPIRFLHALGRWYRESGRTRPLMDALSFHPYPGSAADPLAKGYGWPNAGFVNLDRIKQALWDAFEGTPQPTTVDGLKLSLDEVGWQVDTSRDRGYQGAENVPVTTERSQAAIYGELVREAACDPDVAEVNIFGFRDDSLRSGFQAGLFRADGTPRPSARAVARAIADTAGGCPGSVHRWRPATGVVGASVTVQPQETDASGSVAVTVRTAEGADASAAVIPVRATAGGFGRRYTRARATAVAVTRAHVYPAGAVQVTLRPPARLAPGRYAVVVRLEAEENPARATLVRTPSFVVRAPARSSP